MSFRFQFRRGTTAERNASNPILAAGEPAVVLDSGQPAELVLGDGVTAMADLRAAVWDDDARLALANTAVQPSGLTWGTIADKPAVIGAGATQSDARTALGVPNVTVDSLTFPQVAAHRCGPWLAGESTLASAEIAVAGGIRVLETDFAVTADGVPVLSHGLTLDDSTNGTGTIANLTYAQIVNTVQVDPAAMLPATGYVNQPVATVDELIKAYLGRAVILLENKLTQSIPANIRQALSDRWQAMGAQSGVVIQTFSQADALEWIALGWRTMLVDNGLAADPVTLAGAGYWGVAYPFTGLGVYPYTGFGTAPQLAAITAAKSAGLIVATYTHRYKHESDAALAAGSDIPMSDHPLHALSAPKMSRVANFASNVFPDGVLGYAYGSLTIASGRMAILADGPNEPHGMIGSCGPITETSFTVSMTGRFQGTPTNWLSIFIQGPTDAIYKTQNGYHLLLRPAGGIELYRFTAPATSAFLGNTAGAACVADTDYTITLRVTPTQVIATRVDTGGTVTVNDATHRPSAWWPHVGRGPSARFSLVTVTGG